MGLLDFSDSKNISSIKNHPLCLWPGTPQATQKANKIQKTHLDPS